MFVQIVRVGALCSTETVYLTGARVNICLPTHFRLGDDGDTKWTRKDTRKAFTFSLSPQLNCAHEYFNACFLFYHICDFRLKHICMHILSVNKAVVDGSLGETAAEGERGEKKVWPIKANPFNMTCRGSHSSGKLCTTLLLCFSFHTHITAGSGFSGEWLVSGGPSDTI